LRSFWFLGWLKAFCGFGSPFLGEPCSFCGGLGGVFCGVVSSVGGFSDFLVGSSKPFFFWRLWPGCAVLPAFPWSKGRSCEQEEALQQKSERYVSRHCCWWGDWLFCR
jgi:hypothetical protein